MTGNRLTLHYIKEQREDSKTKILLTEKDWVKLEFGVPTPATKEDFIKVLSDIQVNKQISRCLITYLRKAILYFRFFTYELQLKQK